MILKALLLLFGIVYGRKSSQFILLPKEHVLNAVTLSEFSIANVANQLDLEFLAVFKSPETPHELPFYIAPEDIVERYKDVLTALFDIEENSEISLWSGGGQFVLGDYTDDSKTWHLRRVTQRQFLNGTFNYTQPGSCFQNTQNDTITDAYVIDTGIDVDHPELEGRAKWLANFADDQDTDCNSHGTHVAGIIGSKSFGVCVDANLHAIKVLNCRGSGTLSSVIQGIAFAYETHSTRTADSKDKKVKSVVNMSLGGGKSRAIDRAVKEVMSKSPNFYMVVAAGNENSDACDGSPSGSPHVLTVMASNKNDKRAYFSNWGECADIYAPGVDIWSTVPDGKIAKYSGTSMASPLTAGVLLHYIDAFPDLNMTQMMDKMRELSTKNVIEGRKDDKETNLVYLNR